MTLTSGGDVTFSGDVNSSSDIKLKTNIKTLTNSLEKVLSMRGVEFDRIDLEGNPHQIGVIAQEIEEVIPELVYEDAGGTKSVAYGKITAVLIEAIKDQQNEINELKNNIKKLNEIVSKFL
jgi:archaellum component FlaC